MFDADKEEDAALISMTIPNMACGGCVNGVTAAIRSLDPVAQVRADTGPRTIEVDTTATEAAVRKVLADAGFAPA